ncbi:hypothetical protein VT84_36795 [Gemmata sp. SH-PL17]|nr:hypothetical protein VT84_36795 [Gemmata sp. SH-PL17]
MRVVWGVCAGVLGFCAGCHTHAPAPTRQPIPTVTPVAVELPRTQPTSLEPDLTRLAKTPEKPVSLPTDRTYRQVTEAACQALVTQNAPLANALDDEGRVPANCATAVDQLQQTVRYFAALELRNRAAADGLERFHQLAGAETQAELLRESFPIVDDALKRAKAARAASVRFPLDPVDLERQRTQMLAQLEQAEAGSELLNIDLKRRLGLLPSHERLWPSGDLGVIADAVDTEQAVNAALADRPELRGLRALQAGLSPDTLPVARQRLREANPLLGASPPPVRGLARFLRHTRGPDAEALAELAVRKGQLANLIETRERAVADEARAAVVSLNAQTRRVQLARDRLDSWTASRVDAIKKRDANQPGAEFLVPQVTLEWLKARAEVAAEVTAWHQARVRLKAAQGWFAWEGVGDPRK